MEGLDEYSPAFPRHFAQYKQQLTAAIRAQSAQPVLPVLLYVANVNPPEYPLAKTVWVYILFVLYVFDGLSIFEEMELAN